MLQPGSGTQTAVLSSGPSGQAGVRVAVSPETRAWLPSHGAAHSQPVSRAQDQILQRDRKWSQ